MSRLLPAFLLVFALAACGSDGDGNASFSLDTANMAGNEAQLSANLPGFKGSLTIPRPDIDADDFKLNGVPLYPGSTVSNFKLNADGDEKGKNAVVTVEFDSPAAPVAVRDWFREKLSHADFVVDDSGQGLAGRTDKGKPFHLDLAPDGAERSKGVIQVGG